MPIGCGWSNRAVPLEIVVLRYVFRPPLLEGDRDIVGFLLGRTLPALLAAFLPVVFL